MVYFSSKIIHSQDTVTGDAIIKKLHAELHGLSFPAFFVPQLNDRQSVLQQNVPPRLEYVT